MSINTTIKSDISSYTTKFSLPVCLSVRNGLPNHAHYGDETFTCDSIGLGEGQRLNFIFKKHFLW